jgi:succinyl-CoA synthetase beta subunit
VPVPIVIRMEGTNVDEGKRLLRESGMKLHDRRFDGRSRGKVVQLAVTHARDEDRFVFGSCNYVI